MGWYFGALLASAAGAGAGAGGAGAAVRLLTQPRGCCCVPRCICNICFCMFFLFYP